MPPPGPILVLLTPAADAVWVTTWPTFAQHRWRGAWMNTLFRNEGTVLSSHLILEAVRCSRWYFGDPPPLGMVTFIDPSKVREKRDPGYCYLRAGFVPDGHTEGGLVALRLYPEAMPLAEAPAEFGGSQQLIEGVA